MPLTFSTPITGLMLRIRQSVLHVADAATVDQVLEPLFEGVDGLRGLADPGDQGEDLVEWPSLLQGTRGGSTCQPEAADRVLVSTCVTLASGTIEPRQAPS